MTDALPELARHLVHYGGHLLVPGLFARWWFGKHWRAAWLLMLAVIAITTANPVVFNRTQLGQADLVVEADANSVYRVWPVTSRAQTAEPATVTFSRPYTVVHRRLVPLRAAADGWEVVPITLEADRPPVPLTYDANEASRDALPAFLESLGR